jgi:WD40 repeat protein
VNAVCVVRVGQRELLASAGADETVRLWDPASGASERVLHGHTGGVNAVCAVRVGQRELLASASNDRTVRLWNPASETSTPLLIPTSAAALALSPFGDSSLFIGLDSGVLTVKINHQ